MTFTTVDEDVRFNLGDVGCSSVACVDATSDFLGPTSQSLIPSVTPPNHEVKPPPWLLLVVCTLGEENLAELGVRGRRASSSCSASLPGDSSSVTRRRISVVCSGEAALRLKRADMGWKKLRPVVADGDAAGAALGDSFALVESV